MQHGSSNPPVTRLAPSPTGALHLGNARTFLVNWLLARQRGWRIVLRIEDLDGPRVKKHADQQAMDDLRWLGIDWDEGPIHQSSRRGPYAIAIGQLMRQGDAYPCICTRREVETAASAPHAEDGAAVYPGVCRGRFGSVAEARIAAGREPAIRFRVPPGVISFHDEFRGEVSFNSERELGDFVVAKSDQTAAYQLAVVVDDAAMGITHVVRGDDLLDSTPRQMMLYEALGLSSHAPTYCHLPLVVGVDGRRLAKRHGDTRLSTYRAQGIAPGRILRLLATWCGARDLRGIEKAADLVDRFRLDAMPRQAIVFDGRLP